MIFNKELDESLRLILENDGSRSLRISNFIKSIPVELFEQIYLQLDKYREYEENGIDIFDREDFCLRGECVSETSRKYTFIIDMIENSITISRYMPLMKNEMCDVDFMKTIEITLYADSRYNNMEIFGERRLGRYSDKLRNIDTSYELVDTIFGRRIRYNGDIGFKKYQKINNSCSNKDLQFDNLSTVRPYVKVRKLR